eukprot:2951152-Alexandrium_andersonii.AAC.1
MRFAVWAALVQGVHLRHQEHSSMDDVRALLDFEAAELALVLALAEDLGQVERDAAIEVRVRLLHRLHGPCGAPDVQDHGVSVRHQRPHGIAVHALEEPVVGSVHRELADLQDRPARKARRVEDVALRLGQVHEA